MSVSRDLTAKPSTKFSAGEGKSEERARAGHTLPRVMSWIHLATTEWDGEFFGGKLMVLKMLLQAGNALCSPFCLFQVSLASQGASPGAGCQSE